MHHKTCLLLHKIPKILQLKIEIVIEAAISLTFNFHHNFSNETKQVAQDIYDRACCCCYFQLFTRQVLLVKVVVVVVIVVVASAFAMLH